jgi:hypothetical protein
VRWFHLALGLALALLLTVDATAGKGNKQGKKALKFHGVVTAVDRDKDKDKDKDTGTITVQLAAKRRAGEAANPTDAPEKTFKVTEATRFEKVSGKKGQREVKPAKFADVENGSHVVIAVRKGAPDVAGVVRIHVKVKAE